MSEETSFTIITCGAFAALACVAMFGCRQVEDTARENLRVEQEVERTKQEAIKAGYEETMLPATTSYQKSWTKPKDPQKP